MINVCKTEIFRKVIILLLIHLTTKFCLYSQVAKPLISVIKWNHYANPVSIDVPEFILYEDGLILFKNDVDENSDNLWYVKLSKIETDSLINKMINFSNFATIDSINDYAFFSGDLAIINMWDRNNDFKHYKVIFNTFPDNHKSVPRAFSVLYNYARSYNNENAQLWTPPRFELLLREMKQTRRKKNNYPCFVPLIDESNAKFNHKGLYSFLIDRKHFEAATELLNKRIFFDRKIYELIIRPYIPNEQYWIPFFE